MSPLTYRNIVIGTTVVSLILIFTIPDVVFGLLLELIHFLFDSLFELAHIVFEVIEMALDKLVEHIFHTDLQTTQTIVFYLMLSGGIYIGYLLLRAFIPFCRRCMENVKRLYTNCREFKSRMFSNWHHLDALHKFKWASISIFGLYLLFLVSF